MQNEDYTSIKYLMKELDPTEAVRFEQRMMEDEELLREVECMRRTLRKLEKLPMKEPPSELKEFIVRKACSRNCSSRWRKWWGPADRSFAKYYAAAALIVIGMGLGLLSFQYSDSEKNAINPGPSVTDAEVIGKYDLIENQNSRSAFTSQSFEKPDIALPSHRTEFNQLLDTMHFQKVNQEPSFLSPMPSPSQQSGSIEFTGASR